MLITNLAEALSKAAKTADEIWVAVGLLNSSGLNHIQSSVKSGCIQNFLVGIDLPTEPKALLSLTKLGANVKIFDGEYFHPKMYLFRKHDSFVGYIGSANCTNGGLKSNIELSFSISDAQTGKQLQSWFDKLFVTSQLLTPDFLADYQKKYSARMSKQREDSTFAKQAKKKLRDEAEIILTERNNFVEMLKSYRKRKDYTEKKAEKAANVALIRESLDFSNNFKSVNVDSFFEIWDLGHLIPIPKPTIKREIKTFKKMLRMLCNDDVDIAFRYDEALNGALKIKGVGHNLISKVLAVHRPDIYYIKNGKSERTLRKYGIVFPKGLSEGSKYKATCNYLQQAAEEANISDLVVLDYCLYLEGDEENG